MVSSRAMLVSSSTQLSAAEISLRENSSVTNGPGAAALRTAAAPARAVCDGPLAADPAAGTSATAAATVTALSKPARLMPTVRARPVCRSLASSCRGWSLSRSVTPLMMTTFLTGFWLR